MRAVLVELPTGADPVVHVRAMREIRTWLESRTHVPGKFKYHLSGDRCIVVSEFSDDAEADLFKRRFDGVESEFISADAKNTPDTMAAACRWRLMAEEIRSEADLFSCSSAKATMFTVAHCYEVMAEHLERRLVHEANRIAPGGGFGRYVFG